MSPPTEEAVLPVPDEDSEAFWSALQQGTLLFQQCLGCGHRQLYFRAMCRACWSRELSQVAASGLATIYSFTLVYQTARADLAPQTPFALGLVTLAEGPRILGRLSGDPTAMNIGDPVRLELLDSGGWKLVGFRHGGPGS